MKRIALIGLGNIAHKHAEVIQALSNGELVAGVKRDLSTGEAFCSQYRIPHFFQSTQALLDWGEFDAAIISCGHHFTVELAKAVLSTGRPCLIEKPVGFSSAETQSVLDVAIAASTWGMVAVNRRFYSIIQTARNLLEEAGGIRSIRVEHTEWMHQAAEWGVSDDLLDRYFYINGIHLVDTMCHLIGLPERIDAEVRQYPRRRNAYDAMFRFPSRAVGHYSAQWYAPGRWALDAFAEDLRITFPRMEEAVIYRTGKDAEPLGLDEIDQKFKPGFYRQMEAFLDTVEFYKNQEIKQDRKNLESRMQNTLSLPSLFLSISCFLPEAVEIMKVVERVQKGGHEN